MRINKVNLFICMWIVLSCINIQAYEIRNLQEITINPGQDINFTHLIKQVNIFSPKWNINGTMLAVLEKDATNMAKLKVYRVYLESSGQININHIYTYPENNNLESNNDLPPGTNISAKNKKTVEMVSWSVDNPDILIFQYDEYIWWSYPASGRQGKYRLDKSYREYPKLKGRDLLYGINGTIVKYNTCIYEQKKFRASNPVTFIGNSFFFEIFDQHINGGIFYSNGRYNNNNRVIDFPDTAEILPVVSPDNSKLAFISNRNSRNNSIDGYDRNLFQRNQWSIYAAIINSKRISNVTKSCISLSHENVKLNFQYGNPDINWIDNNSIIYIQDNNSKIYVTNFNNNVPQPVRFSDKIKDSEIIRIDGSEIIRIKEVAYNLHNRLIAICAYRKANECWSATLKNSPECSVLHDRIFVGQLSRE